MRTGGLDWLSVVGERGWVALTRDTRIRYKPNELAAVRATPRRAARHRREGSSRRAGSELRAHGTADRPFPRAPSEAVDRKGIPPFCRRGRPKRSGAGNRLALASEKKEVTRRWPLPPPTRKPARNLARGMCRGLQSLRHASRCSLAKATLAPFPKTKAKRRWLHQRGSISGVGFPSRR